MGKTKTNGSPFFSCGRFLFMGVALLLLPTAFGSKCKHVLTGDEDCGSGDDYCVKRWSTIGAVGTFGCTNNRLFFNAYGFYPSVGCGETLINTNVDAYACACPTYKGDLCNDGDFGEEEYKAWKERKDGGGPSPGDEDKDKDKDKTTRGHDGGHSSGNGLSNLLGPLTMTMTLALTLTVGAVLAC